MTWSRRLTERAERLAQESRDNAPPCQVPIPQYVVDMVMSQLKAQRFSHELYERELRKLP